MMKPANLLISLLISLYSLSLFASQTTVDDDLRSRFVLVDLNLNGTPYERIDKAIEPFRDYPLFPYLLYRKYTDHLDRLNQAELSQFFSEFPHFPNRDRLQRRWLDHLATSGRWNELITAYNRLPQTNPEYRCRYAEALHQIDRPKQAMQMARSLWLVGKSQPATCDRLFNIWFESGHPTQKEAMQRYWLSTEAKQQRLAGYLHRYLSPKDLKLAKHYEKLYASANSVIDEDLSPFPAKQQDLLISKAFKTLARADLLAAASRWLEYRSHLASDSKVRELVDLYIGKRLTYSDDASAAALLVILDPNFRYSELTEARVRSAMGAKEPDWRQILTMIDSLPEKERQSDRWQYWHAQAHTLIDPNSALPMKVFATLSQSRSFYGFLAAERLNKPFVLENTPVKSSRAQLTELEALGPIGRAKELLSLGRLYDANREWRSARSALSESKRAHMASLSSAWGWHHRSIMDAIREKQWDYLAVRFPTAFEQDFTEAALQREIDPTWAIAIARQESAFNPKARSHAGARGLMQLMPATARSTAKKHSIKLTRLESLYQPNTNISLGTAYLSEMFQRFDENRAYASAAYNAGPHRVDRWLKERGHLALDSWIETIPFKETRNYVQNVLSFRVIYDQRAGREASLLSPKERQLLAYQQNN